MKKKIFFILLTLVMLVTILVVYVNKVFFPVQFKQIVLQKTQALLNRTVNFDSIQFSPLKGIVITNLNISDKNSPDVPFLHVDELHFSILYAPILRDKKIIIPQLTVEKPVISLRRYSSAEWNFSDLLNLKQPQPLDHRRPGDSNTTSSQSSFNFFLGGVAVVDGDLTILDKTVDPSFLEILEDLNIKTSLSPQGGIKFSLEANLPKSVTTLKIQGDSDFSFQKINAHLTTANIKLAQYFSLYYKNDHFNLKDATIKTVDINFARNGDIIKTTAQLEAENFDLEIFPDKKIRGTQLKVPVFDLTLDMGKNAQARSTVSLVDAEIQIDKDKKIQGDVDISQLFGNWQPDKTQLEGSFTIKNAKAQLGAQQTLSGQLKTKDFLLILNQDGPTQLSGSATIDDLIVLFKENQAIRGQLHLNAFALNVLNGRLDLKGNLQVNQADILLDKDKEITGQLDAKDCLLTSNTDGKIDFTTDLTVNNLKAHLAEQQSIQGQLSLRPLTLTMQNRTVDLKGNLQLIDGDILLDKNKEIKGDIQTSQLTLLLDSQKAHLITDHVDLNNLSITLSADQTATGNLNLSLDLTYNPEDKNPVAYSGTLHPKITLLTGIPVVKTIKNISGKITFVTDQINMETLTLTALDTPLELSGTIAHFLDPILDLKASAEKFDLGKISILAPNLLEEFQITPTGEAKITLQLNDKISHLNTTNISQANMSATALLKETTLKGEKLPGPVTGINGEIDYEKDTVSWKNLQMIFQDKDFSSNGQFRNFSNPQIKGTLTSKNLGLDLSTQMQLQMQLLDRTLSFDSLKGTYQHSTFDVAGQILLSENKEPFVDFKGQVVFDLKDLSTIQPELKKTLESFKPAGTITGNGSLKGTLTDWRNWELSFSAQSPQIIFSGYSVQDLAMNIRQADQWIKHFDLLAQVYDGKLKADGQLSLNDEQWPYQLNADLQNADLQKLKETTIWKDREVSGFLTGAVHVQGSFKNWKKMEGDGNVLIHDGNIWQLNLFQGLGKLIFTSDYENIPINQVGADFKIQDERVATENLFLQSPVFAVSGKGWVDFNHQLDFNINTEFESQLPTGSETYQQKISNLLTQFGSVLNIKITGSLNNPKYTPVPAPGRILEKGIQLFLEGVKDAI